MKLLRNNGLFYLGTNSERLLNFTLPLLEGTTFYETDTNNLYQEHYGQWILINSSNKKPIRTITLDDTIILTDYRILADANLGNIIVDLPTTSSSDGFIFVVTKIDATANTVTVTPNGIETINGLASYIVSIQWDSVVFQSNGTAWYTIG